MPNWTARNLAGLVHGWSGTWQDRDGWPEVWPGRRKEAGGPDWRVAARKLEKRGSRQRPAAADDWKNQYLSIISIVLKTACPSTPRSAAPGCLFCRRPLTCRPTGCPAGRRRLPGPPVSTGCPAGRRRLCRLLCRPLLPVGLSGVPPRRRRPAVPLVAPPVAAASAGCCAGRSFPSASREFLSADADPSPPGATGFDRLLRRSLLPAGHSH